MESNIEDKLQDLTSELLFIGTIYKYPGMFPKYRRYLGEEDFSTPASRFFMGLFIRVYDTYSKTPDENSIAGFLVNRKQELKKFNEYGGYSTVEGFMNTCNSNDIEMYFDNIKKYSLLRAYHEKGFPVLDILQGAQDKRTGKSISFSNLKAKHISRILLNRISTIYTRLRNNEDMQDLVENCTDYVLDKLDRPQMGLPFPYPIMSETFSGIRKKQFMAWGMLSNAGKSRFLMKIISHLAFVENQKVLLLANEMSYEEMKECMITTVLDNPEFQKMHGFIQLKPQKEIVNGIYRDKNGKIIPREVDDFGVMKLTKEEFIEKLTKEYPDFNLTIKAMKWLDEKFMQKLYIIDMGADYSDGALQELIENAKNVDGIDYVFYDTFKADKEASGDWSKLKNTATMLKELAKELDIFIGANIQLTDDAITVDPLNLSSLNIANCKQIKHVMDGLCLFKGIPKSEYNKYGYVQILRDEKTGAKMKSELLPLDINKTYYVCRVDKNRNGDKPNLMFELNLDFNTWFEVGLAYSTAQYEREQNAIAGTNAAKTRKVNQKKKKTT